jgi:hypothetical protein
MPGLELGGDAKLQGFILGLFWGCFQDGHAWSPFIVAICMAQCITKLLPSILRRGQDSTRRMRGRAGATPQGVWAAESRTDGVAPARLTYLAAYQFCGLSLLWFCLVKG